MNDNDNNCESLSGIIERVTYHNAENGFAVIKIKVKGIKDLVVVIGNVPAVSAGEYVKCRGVWYNHPDHGLQFKADYLKSLPPSSLEGIEKYLGSGLIKGIGSHFAKKLVKKFGEQVFDVIENNPEKLSTIEGIGKFRASSICDNWQEQKIVREIMVFLQSHGIGTTRATRIYKTYGDNAINIVSSNPYKLAKDIRGIGFASADIIARNLGIEQNSIIRAEAGINHVLFEATGQGHCGLPITELIESAVKLLEIDKDTIAQAIENGLRSDNIVKDKLNNINNTETIFLAGYFFYEKKIASTLLKLQQQEVVWSKIDTQTEIPAVESRLDIKLADSQKLAIMKLLENKVMVITGGPGTGKTTLVNAILHIIGNQGLKIKLCAPTGRAAKRLSQTTAMEALTIHRLLAIDPTNGNFKYNENNKLECDYLIVDESSMIDVPLFCLLVGALPEGAGLLLVGDVDQLPAVGAGQVLADIIASKTINTIRLTEIFRQAATSNIITNAHLVNKGRIPDLENKSNYKTGQINNQNHNDTPACSDFYFINAEAGEDLQDKLICLIKERIPNKFNLDARDDIQVLCPMQRGGNGVRSLNIRLQQELNPNYHLGISKFGQTFAVNDKIMQTENNYDKEVYNGDVGIIESIDNEEQEVTIRFEDRMVIYDYTELDQITLAYATTIHKSQGSEYPAVIIPLTMQSYMMLRKNLIYTAITRGKKLVIILGEKKALVLAIKNRKDLRRYSKLQDWLEEISTEIKQNPTQKLQ